MDALSHASFAPRRVTLSEVVAKLKGFLPNALIEPKPLTPEEMAAIREDLGRELAALEDAGKQDLPRLAAAEVKARKQLEALRPAFRAAEAALAKASGDHFRRAHDLQYAEENVRRRIAAVADPVIGEFMDDVTDLFQASLGQQVEFELRGEYYDFAALKRYAEVWTDAPSRFAFRQALLAARSKAEAMKSDPDQTGIRERLAAILDALPDASLKVKKVKA